MRRGGGEGGWYLKYQVSTGEEGGFRAEVFIKDGGFAALDKAAAHDCDQIVRAGLLPRLFHMVNMSRVKRVVFYDDACCFQSDKYLHVHGFLTF